MILYKYMKSEYALLSLREQHLKISRMAELNDPFEFHALDLSNDVLREALKKEKEIFSNSCGILCFSRNWNNPVLWAHYADGHKGICLGFDFEEDSNLCVDVEYVDDRLSTDRFLADNELLSQKISSECERQSVEVFSTKGIEIGKKFIENSIAEGNDIHEQIRKSMYGIKYRHWQYEEESRLLVSLDKEIDEHYYFDFSNGLRIRKVILGLRSNVTKQCVQHALGNQVNSVKIFKAREHHSKFEMTKN